MTDMTTTPTVSVPVEPTREMLNAAIDVDSFKLGNISPLGFRISPQMLFERCWSAMLAAAPAREAGEWFGVTGAADETEALAVALFDARCPGIRMTDEDLHYYRSAAQRALKAVADELDTPALTARHEAPASAVDDLVDRFAAALKEKLQAAEAKYGHDDAWLCDDWRDDLIRQFADHVHKGDPRDVAAYCAFAWHHGWSVKPFSVSGENGAAPAEGAGSFSGSLALALEDLSSAAEVVRRMLRNSSDHQSRAFDEAGIPFVTAINRAKLVLKDYDRARSAPEASPQVEAVAQQWRVVDEQGPRTAWRELDWRSKAEVSEWEASTPHKIEYRSLYTHPQPAQTPGVGGDEVELQPAVHAWMLDCFGETIAADKVERADRFIEEALELTQAVGYSPERAHALVDYVFGRSVGEPSQEVGGVMITLAALCNTFGLDIDAAAQTELARITQPEIVLKIRAKQAAKPTGSALPIAALTATQPDRGVEGEDEVEDTIWPESPLATALFKHVQSEFSLHDDEAADVAGEIISILVKHGVDPTTLPPIIAKPADGGLREALEKALAEVVYTPGDYPVVPVKHAAFVKAVQAALAAGESEK